MSNSPKRILIPALLAALVLGACRYFQKPDPEPLPISSRLTWDGLAPEKYAAFPASAKGSQISSGVTGVHEFEFAGADSVGLRLHEYREPFLAYEAFQKRATFAEISEGYFRKGGNLIFFHGPYSGEVRFINGGMVPAHYLKEKLVFKGEPLFLSPFEFASFPLLGRIPHSERVYANHFLGRNWRGPVFSVSYRCHGDTATAFLANAQDMKMVDIWLQEWHGRSDTLGRGSELRFQGRDEFRRPLVFWVFLDAIVGMEGCSDMELALEYTRKLGKMRTISSKP